MSSIIDKAKNNIIEYSMIVPGDSVLVALSGGADSVVLLSVLNELKHEMNFSIGAAHVNHSIRKGSADSDQGFCAELCNKLNIPFYTQTIDIPKISKELKISEENAGRQKRYEFFNNICENNGFTKIAVAHNMNDSVETVILNLIRGSSLNGLTGIKPVNKNIIRPIFNILRSDIEMYLKNNKIPYCTDETNNENIYTRNKIRNLVIKQMEDINPSLVKTIFSNLKNIREDVDFISQTAKNTGCIYKDGNEVIIDKNIFSYQHKSVKRRILYEAFLQLSGNCNNIESKHIDILMNTLSSGKQYDLPNGIIAVSSFDKIILTYKAKISSDDFITEITPPCSIKYKDDNVYIFSLETSFSNFEPDVLYIDYEKVKKPLMLRSRRDGDTMTPFGLKGTKKIKKIMCELKIPTNKRNLVPLLCDGEEIVALIPYQINDKYKVTDKTSTVLKIHIQKEK